MMKKIICNKCCNEWLVSKDVLNELTVCPFCCTSIVHNSSIDDVNTLDEAIYLAYQVNDGELFNNSIRLMGYLTDIVPQLKKEIHIFFKAFNDQYLRALKSICEENDRNTIKFELNKLKMAFINEEGLSEEWSNQIYDWCFNAITYSDKHNLFNVDIEDVSLTNLLRNEESTKNKSKLYGEIDRMSLCKQSESKNVENRHHQIACKSINTEMILIDGKQYDYDSAISLLTEMAQNRDVNIYNSIGELCYAKKKYRRAWKWFSKSAERNDKLGLFYLGLFYLYGFHVATNEKMAIKSFEKSARQGLKEAALMLESIYKSKRNREKSEHYKDLADNLNETENILFQLPTKLF
jgi:hypothetical protein